MNSFTSSSNRIYLLIILSTSITLASVIAATNYIVDPSGIYHYDRDRYKELAIQTLNSEHGIVLPTSSNNRRYKKEIALNFGNDIDCIVIGSSHVKQVSSHREEKSLSGICGKIINLGVDGASLEDYLILGWLALQNPNITRGVKFIFGIDPWSIGFNRDKRWINYGIDSSTIKALIQKEDIDNTRTSKLENLINIDYFMTAVKELPTRMRGENKARVLTSPPDTVAGIEKPVNLPDGSLIYSSEFISEHNSTPIPINGLSYKSESLEDPIALEIFEQYIRTTVQPGREVFFLMTPYAPNVFIGDNTQAIKQLEHMELVIKALARTLGIETLGSYNPRKMGCINSEFYDYMHPKSSCLRKIKTNQANTGRVGLDN